MFARKIGGDNLSVLQYPYNELFENISYQRRFGTSDMSFLATARTLLWPRNEEIFIVETTPIFMYNESATNFVESIPVLMRFRPRPYLNIMSFSDTYFDRAVEYYSKYEDKIQTQESKFLLEKSGIKNMVLVDKEEKVSVVIIKSEDRSTSFIHLLQALFPKLCPWAFEEKPLTEKEIKLLNTLLKRSVGDYVDAINECFDEMNIREGYIKKYLADFETKFIDIDINNRTTRAALLQRRADEAMQSFVDYMTEKHEVEITIIGLHQKKAEGNETHEIMDYFLRNKNISLVNVNNTSMAFKCYTTMHNYDQDVFNAYIENTASFFYRYSPWSTADTKLFFEALFGAKSTLKLRVSGLYYINIANNSVSTTSFEENSPTYIGNPHIARYHCLGDYPRFINTLLTEGDYIGAIEMCFESAASINWNDYAVATALVASLTTETTTCIELPDGNIVKPADALKYLKEKENAQ